MLYACQMIVTSFMRHLRKIRCSKLLDGEIRCHGVLLAVSGVTSIDYVHPSIWQHCLQTFLLFTLQVRNKPSFLAHKQFLLHLFFHNLSACSMQHVQAKEDKCNIGTGTGEAHQTPNDFLWSNFSNTGDSFFWLMGCGYGLLSVHCNTTCFSGENEETAQQRWVESKGLGAWASWTHQGSLLHCSCPGSPRPQRDKCPGFVDDDWLLVTEYRIPVWLYEIRLK